MGICRIVGFTVCGVVWAGTCVCSGMCIGSVCLGKDRKRCLCILTDIVLFVSIRAPVRDQGPEAASGGDHPHQRPAQRTAGEETGRG